MRSKTEGADLLPLRRMASRLGVPSRWLREMAESGKVPGLRAGNRWLFAPDVVGLAVRAMAGDSVAAALSRFADAVKDDDCDSRESALVDLRNHGIDSAANLAEGGAE
jgi:hypothetical protein